MVMIPACRTSLPASKLLTEANAGGSVIVTPNDIVTVKLEGNATTGYRWETKDIDEEIARPYGEPAYTSHGTQPGASGTFTMQYRAIATGRTKILLVYRRPFEKDAAPARTYEFQLIVN